MEKLKLKIRIERCTWKEPKSFGNGEPYIFVEYKRVYFADKNGEMKGEALTAEVPIAKDCSAKRDAAQAVRAVQDYFAANRLIEYTIINKAIEMSEAISPDQWIRAQAIAKLQAKATELQASISNLQTSLTAVEMELEELMNKEMGSTGADPKKIQEALESESDAYYTHQYNINKNGNE